MKAILRSERGMALAIAIIVLAVAGALMAAAFLGGTQEQRAADNSRRALQAFGVAEEGAYEVINEWSPATYNTRGIYPTDSLSLGGYPTSWETAASKTGVYGGYLYKLNDEVYLIDMTGRDVASVGSTALAQQGGGGQARLGVMARVRPIQLPTRSALTTGNGDKVAGNSTIDGFDHIPAAWANCGPLDTARAGIRADQGDTVTIQGNASVTGQPPIVIDPSIDAKTFNQFGSVSYADLAAMAITLPPQNFNTSIGPVVSGGTCNQAVLTNWGDPLNPTAPCGTYFPIIHITGDATINGVEGQGILLVDGNLAVQGGFQWFGITIVKGSLSTAGGGGNPAHFWGTTLVQDSVSLGQLNLLVGSANLLYSSCAVRRALEGTAVATPMRSRSWTPLF